MTAYRFPLSTGGAFRTTPGGARGWPVEPGLGPPLWIASSQSPGVYKYDGENFIDFGSLAATNVLYEWNNQVVAGGSNHVSILDGSSWNTILVPDSSAQAIIDYQGDMVVGGFRVLNQNNFLASWNGINWSDIDNGAFNSTVHDAIIWNGYLVVCGAFAQAGGAVANQIARWDGTSWIGFGDGLTEGFPARTLAIYNGDLVVGGGFEKADGNTVNGIARWTGSTFVGFAGGVNGAVWQLNVIDDELIAVGGFTEAGGNTVNRLARWTGSTWDNPYASINNANVYGLKKWRGDIIIHGNFTNPQQRNARWDGIQWVQEFGASTWIPNDFLVR